MEQWVKNFYQPLPYFPAKFHQIQTKIGTVSIWGCFTFNWDNKFQQPHPNLDLRFTFHSWLPHQVSSKLDQISRNILGWLRWLVKKNHPKYFFLHLKKFQASSSKRSNVSEQQSLPRGTGTTNAVSVCRIEFTIEFHLVTVIWYVEAKSRTS